MGDPYNAVRVRNLFYAISLGKSGFSSTLKAQGGGEAPGTNLSAFRAEAHPPRLTALHSCGVDRAPHAVSVSAHPPIVG